MSRKNKNITKKLRLISLKLSPGWILATLIFMCGSVYAATGIINNQAEITSNDSAYLVSENNITDENSDKILKSSSESSGDKDKSQPDDNKDAAPPTPDPEPDSAGQARTVPNPAPSSPAIVTPQAVAPPTPAPPNSSSALETASSLQYINSLRQSAGKSGLQQNGVMNNWALSHAINLANNCELNHQNLNTFLGQNIGVGTVSSIAENVGYAGTIPKVLDGLKNSPGHFANMTGDYDFVGLGVVNSASGQCKGYVYTTQIFAK